MSEHIAIIEWAKKEEETFSDNQYSREHTWQFDGGLIVPASPSPSVVPIPLSNPDNIDPEEAYVAAISSCHMLTFLSIAAKRKLVITRYYDKAVGELTTSDNGIQWVSKVTLRPEIEFLGDKQPSTELLEKMHHIAHQNCFIANSVKTEIVTEIL